MKRYTEEAILATWSHVEPGTLRFEQEGKHAGKQTVQIRTRNVSGDFDGNTRRVATSDLFQCFWTEETKDELDKRKRSAKRKLSTKSRDEGLEALRNLDTVEKAQVALCLAEGHPRIEAAHKKIKEETAKLDAKAEVKPKAKTKAKKSTEEAAEALGV